MDSFFYNSIATAEELPPKITKVIKEEVTENFDSLKNNLMK